ncbi:exopolysaccharide transport family protein [Paludisphaera rhizosphaerae]|uniref:exopolysaccharide transport family protein n=1 Tax=Paludisphaera rhizosphaerae TaxID=2711216 RepID=UPI0013E9FA5C|nr:polysaccharide biosynthesis tyrosine autokinase [Paludisphaera rhizosphaerae]
MEISDRHDSTLPARSLSPSPSPLTPARPAASFGERRELATVGAGANMGAGPTTRIDPVSILRGLARNWWKILGLWLAASAPLLYLIYTQVKPTYQAVSMIEVHAIQPDLFGSDNRNSSSMADRKLETEINAITVDDILNEVVADPSVVNLPIVKNSTWPVQTLRNKLVVFNLPKTELIRVSLDSTDPVEAANVVNAVVRTYMDTTRNKKSAGDEQFMKSLKTYLDSKNLERQKKEAELFALMDKGDIDPDKVTVGATKGSQGAKAEQSTNKPSLEQNTSFEEFRKYKSMLLENQVKLLEAQAELDQRSAGFEEVADVAEDPNTATRISKAELTQLVAAQFYRLPPVAELLEKMRDIEGQMDRIEKGTRKGNDPALRRFQTTHDDLKARIEEKWQTHRAEVEEQVKLSLQQGRPAAAGGGDQHLEGRPRTIPELREIVLELQRKEAAITKALDQTQFETQQLNSDTFRAQFLQTQIESIVEDERVVNRKLQDLDFRYRDSLSVELRQEASIPRTPSDSKRLKLMAAAPLALLIALLGLFSLFEIKAERVGDPDSLSSRVQSEVYSLPPIPMSRSPRRLGSNGDDNIDRFIQRLDHLRFAICGDHPDVGLGRCVLITSAVGGEGKTTLAAQLAARCGHAGHSTLLIDADLRRGALSPLLDVAEGLGLNDVLTREDLNVEDVVIPVQGGTFHLLCAGTPTSDTSRVFQGRSFGMLIARLRQLYDLIIIDSPPILPVPDALIMGRWTDGVVLASRYDVSRAPQVERARRQLDLAGIPVLGTVINGMRSSDSYYGRYTYSRQPTASADPGVAGDETSPE